MISLRLFLPNLERSSRLQDDISFFHPSDSVSVSNNQEKEPGVPSSIIAPFISHIERVVVTKPHLQIAYTWVFYMALFSWGRYIRAKLRSAGEDFWASAGLPKAPSDGKYVEEPEQGTIGLSFWEFSGSSDGKDLKAEYKSRLHDLEASLTLEERQEIVNEAMNIMLHLIEIAKEIKRNVSSGLANEGSLHKHVARAMGTSNQAQKGALLSLNVVYHTSRALNASMNQSAQPRETNTFNALLAMPLE